MLTATRELTSLRFGAQRIMATDLSKPVDAELAGRYFDGNGPATARDFAWWAGITLGDARKGISAAGRLHERDFDGVSHYFAKELEPARSFANSPSTPLSATKKPNTHRAKHHEKARKDAR